MQHPHIPRLTRPAPGLRCVLAPNPSPMTLHGTNTWLVGEGAVAVIDPGPDMAAHQDAILAALAPGERISHIFVTHAHLDHSPLARRLSDITGAPVLAFGDWQAGRSPQMVALAGQNIGGGEGVDRTFAPDIDLPDGAEVDGHGWTLTAHWMPGHFGNHMCFAWQGHVFSGDLVMGWASSLISPPDGDMGAYMASLARLGSLSPRTLLPGHGPVIPDPAGRIAELTAHRRMRESAIRTELREQWTSIPALTARIYRDIPASMLPAAERNVLAHLIDLVGRDLAQSDGPPGMAGTCYASPP